MIRFFKPSPARALWCIAAVTVFTCVITGIAMSIAMILASSDSMSPPTGEYVRLFIVNITMWSPILLVTVWFLSVPLILGMGLLLAYIHTAAPLHDTEFDEQDPTGGQP